MPLSRGSSDVIGGMDWLSNRKFVIICHEKVVRLPLEGDEILRVHGERTLGAAEALMNAKVDEPKISDIPVVRDLTDVFSEDLSMTTTMTSLSSYSLMTFWPTQVRRRNMKFILFNPLTSLSERNQKYEWSVEQEEAFQTLKNALCDTSDKANVVGDALSGKGESECISE
ncbi:hypothetical protein Tco_1292804 [Tanacetum coccineum]